MFFWNSVTFLMIQQMLAVWSLSSAYSKTSLNIWNFTVHILLKPGLENFEHYSAVAAAAAAKSLQSCDPMNRSTPGLPVHHQLLEFTQTHFHFDCVDHNKLWNILKQMGIPDHLTCLLRNLCAGQEATVRTGHGITDWLQTGKGDRPGWIQ